MESRDRIGEESSYENEHVSQLRRHVRRRFGYYEKHLGAKVGMVMTHGQAPGSSAVTPEWKDAVLHGRISIGETELMAADIPDAEPMHSAHLTLRFDTDADAGAAYFLSALRCGTSTDADTEDVLCHLIWPGARSVRCELDDSMRTLPQST